MSPGKLLGLLIGVAMALAGPGMLIGAGIWWEGYRPAGWPNYHVNGPFGCCTFHLPDGSGARLKALQKAEEAAAARAAVVVARQSAVTAVAGQREAVAQVQIRTVYRTLHDQVTTYVPTAADAQCVVPVGFVRLHDAAAGGVPVAPDPASELDGGPSGIALSAVAETVIDNYGAANANAEQLSALQAWIRAEQAAAGN